MPSARRTRRAIPLFLIAASPLAGQQKAALTRPDATYEEPFTAVRSIREVGPDKVLISDAQDKVVQLVDLASGTATTVGREGKGPGEYALPMALLPLPNGQTLLQDLMNRRFLTIGPDGKVGPIVEFPRPQAPPASAGGNRGGMITMGGMLGGLGVDLRADAQGRIYFLGSPFRGPSEPAADSVPILRWDRVRPTFDTLGYIKVPPGSTVVRPAAGGGAAMMFRTGGGRMFMPVEAWDVTPEGRIARVTPSPFRVFWSPGDGRWTAGPVVPYSPIKVTDKDKEEALEARRRARPVTITMGTGPGGRAAPGPAPTSFPQEEPEFEPTKPPFQSQQSVLAAPGGEVWVLRTRPAGDQIPRYDVFDRTGTLAKQVTLNPRSRVVGFGQGTVYVARSDEDDLQYLERYRKP